MKKGEHGRSLNSKSGVDSNLSVKDGDADNYEWQVKDNKPPGYIQRRTKDIT